MAYGLTYQWNEEGTEAFLLERDDFKNFDVIEGNTAFTQTWDFPSRAQCMTCHNPNANFILGLKTHQLNGDLYYPTLNQSRNQLEYLNELGVFNHDIGYAAQYPRAFAIDDQAIQLELRIRSYLDANCASCHRPNGITELSMDLRFSPNLTDLNLINASTQSHSSAPNRKIVQAGYHEASELWIRDASHQENRMPPIGRNIVDQVYIDALAEWIDNMETTLLPSKEHLIFPNPTSGWLEVRLQEDWSGHSSIRLFNQSGQLVKQLRQTSNFFFLDLTNEPKGLYVMEITNADGQKRYLERFIIQ